MRKQTMKHLPALLASCSLASLSAAVIAADEVSLPLGQSDQVENILITVSTDKEQESTLKTALATTLAELKVDKDNNQRPLSIDSIVQYVLDQNAQIIYADLQRQLSEEKIQYETGAYQAEFFSSLKYSDAHVQRTAQEKQSSYTATGKNILDESNTSLNFGVRKLLSTGGEATISYNAAEKDNNIIPTSADPSIRDSEFTTAVSLQLRQPLLQGLHNVGVESRIRRAELEVGIVEAQYQQQLLKMVSQALSLYWQLYKATRFLEVRSMAVDNAEKMVVDIAKRVKSGKESDSALIDAKSELLKRKVSLAGARQAQNEVSYQVSTLMNSDVNNLSIVRYVLESGPDRSAFELSGSFEDYYQRVYRIWPNVKILKQNIAIQDEEIRVAEDSNLPKLDLELGYSSNNLAKTYEGGDAFNGDYPTWNIGLNFSMPIGQNKRANAQKVMAILKQEQHKEDLRAVEVSLKNDLRARLFQVRTSYQEMNTLQENINILEDLYQSELRKFNVGYGNIKDIYQREDSLNLERQRYIDGMIKYELAKVSMALADGSLLNP